MRKDHFLSHDLSGHALIEGSPEETIESSGIGLLNIGKNGQADQEDDEHP